MKNFEEEFIRNFHMTPMEFDALFERVRHRIEPEITRDDVIFGEERLALTLE